MSSRTEASQPLRPHLDNGIKASHEIEASSQPVQDGAYITQQPERSDANSMQSPNVERKHKLLSLE